MHLRASLRACAPRSSWTRTPLLRSLYRDVDFTEIHFTRHLVRVLASRGADRFAPVVAELKALWVQRMKSVLARLPQRRVLLWMADHAPPEPGAAEGLGNPPWLIDRGMIDALRPMVSAYVEQIASPAARSEGVRAMRFPAAEEAAAADLPGAAVHQEVAQALLPVVEGLL